MCFIQISGLSFFKQRGCFLFVSSERFKGRLKDVALKDVMKQLKMLSI